MNHYAILDAVLPIPRSCYISSHYAFYRYSPAMTPNAEPESRENIEPIKPITDVCFVRTPEQNMLENNAKSRK